MKPGDPPILVASHTNHALDQLLRYVKQFDEEFIRLGAFTTDKENIKPRTMYEVKQAFKKPDVRSPFYPVPEVPPLSTELLIF